MSFLRSLKKAASQVPKRARAPLKLGKLSDVRTVPSHIERPPYLSRPFGVPAVPSGDLEIKDEDAIARMRDTCSIAAEVRKYAGSLVEVGMTTEDLDRMLHDKIIQYGAYPSPLGYSGFPKSVCTSVNEVQCHGIPDDQKLQDGDVISIDVSVFKNGVHGDCCGTFFVGEPDENTKNLASIARSSLYKAVGICGPGVPFSKIGNTIGEYIAKNSTYSVVPEFCGHGIGEVFHQPPLIYHHPNSSPGVMEPGMTFTIEPIIVEGKAKNVIWSDGWTAASADGGWGAQFEQTILITPEGTEILTVPIE